MALTKVVGRAIWLANIAAPDANPDPTTISLNESDPAPTVVCDRLLIAGALTALSAAAQDKGHGAFVAQAKEVVTKNFKDPEGARFRNLAVYRSNTGSLALCGEVNAKNGFGAFVGYRAFLATVENASLREEGDDMLFDTLKTVYCDKKLADAK